MNELLTIGGIIVVAILGALGLYSKGKSSGAKEQRAQTNEAVAKQAQASVTKTKDIENEVNQKSDADVVAAANEWVRGDQDRTGRT